MKDKMKDKILKIRKKALKAALVAGGIAIAYWGFSEFSKSYMPEEVWDYGLFARITGVAESFGLIDYDTYARYIYNDRQEIKLGKLFTRR